MLEQLKAIEDRYEEITYKLSEPGAASNQQQYRQLMKEVSDLGEIVNITHEYKECIKDIEGVEDMLREGDKEMEELLREEHHELKQKLAGIEEKLKDLLTPKDPNDDRNAIIEIRGGVGGEEAALFAGDLFRAYNKYADRKGWKTEIMDINETELGGCKEVVFSIEGKGAYGRFKYEGGGHRVQRVPETEASGRIHTSAVTVAVLPEIDAVDFEMNMNDLKIDTYRSGGAGGQHVNRTDSAIRITHLPTGLVVTCQDERSQLKNKERALGVMRSKLYEAQKERQTNEINQEKKVQVGSGDRNSRVRTYNFPQGRVTDHRIGLSLYKILEIMNGDLDELIDALITADRANKLGSGEGED